MAGFIGQSNLIPGVVECCSADGAVTVNAGGISLPAAARGDVHLSTGDKAVVCLRPQRIRYGAEPQHGMGLTGRILSKSYSGGMQHTQIALSDSLVLSAVSHSSELDSFPVGSTVHVGWSGAHTPAVPDAESAGERA